MKVLSTGELHVAEGVLKKYLPRSYKVYGFLHGINRKKPSTLEFVVDSWPDFKVILCRPDPKNKRVQDFVKKVSFYSTDEDVLKKMLREEIDWSPFFLIGGSDISHEPTIKEVALENNVSQKSYIWVRLLYLPDTSYLPTSDVDSELESRISSLNLSHADTVNKTWKFGGDERGYRNIKNLISNFLSICIMDVRGKPVAWILMYDFCAVGLLYTLPEHRGKGYAKVLISTMAKKLHADGFPVYCFIEEENMVSYKLFKNMGFVEDSSYRAVWFQFNFSSFEKDAWYN
ncbi:glycine N-acyltransferase-like protein 3 [Austrofundulus limnaeus]|uniref:Glycine N-acyltransferase-like protein n=1 Tax=Austrofundulus limnaeus TaxID=52670 RepID=A0A2I4B106_AUSLI|nr:PREDICTED: glycine N-acyltransferase-like protein 3 [Austrofundulus limnaeus]